MYSLKRYLGKLLTGCSLCCLLGVPWVQAEEAISMVTAPPADEVTFEQVSKVSLKNELKAMRIERFERMPYLERGYIAENITQDSLQNTEAFLSEPHKHLEDVIRRAVEVHTPARAASERVSLARRRIMIAVRELFPEISFRTQERDGSLSGTAFNSRDWRWSFRQPVFRGGILWNTLLKEQADLEASEKEYEQVLSDLRNDVSAAYFEYNRTLEAVEDQQKALDQVKSYVNISEQKWEEQIISEIEHLNVQSLHSQMRYDYESGKQELELAKLELQKYLDLDVDHDLVISDLYDVKSLLKNKMWNEAGGAELGSGYSPESVERGITPGMEVPNLELLVDLSYHHRPELQVESSRLQSARLQERIRWGDFMPQVDFIVEFGKLGEAFDEITLDPKLQKEYRIMVETRWNLGGNQASYTFENDSRGPSVTQFQTGSGSQITRSSFSFGVLDGLSGYVNTKEAEIAKLDRIVDLENAEKEVIRDVKEAYFDYQRASIQVKATLKRVDYRDRLVKLAKHRMETNEIQISEYLQAEIDLLREKIELHRALTDYFTAKAKLNRAVGIRDFLKIEEVYGQT